MTPEPFSRVHGSPRFKVLSLTSRPEVVLINVDVEEMPHEYTQKLEHQAWLVSPETRGP